LGVMVMFLIQQLVVPDACKYPPQLYSTR
jgi:hypothetical protein